VLEADLRHRVEPGDAHSVVDAGLRLPDLLAFLRPASEEPLQLPLSRPVEVDVQPESEINSLNPASRGVIPVAVFGTDRFDVADVDPTTLAFGPGAAPLAHRNGPHADDLDGDGITDLLAHFRVEETGISFGDEEVCLSGELLDGTPFAGCDVLRTVPQRASGSN
jgi:hypothetical protein